MKCLLLPVSALLLGACASVPDDQKPVRGVAQFADDARLGEPATKICFASSIDGFGETTRDTVIVDEGRDHYLIETFGTCQNLNHAQRIGFDPKGSTCLRAGDQLIVSDSMFEDTSQLGRNTCSIKAIYHWDPKAKSEPATDDSDADGMTDSES